MSQFDETRPIEWWERMADAYRNMRKAFSGRPEETWCEIQAERAERQARLAQIADEEGAA